MLLIVLLIVLVRCVTGAWGCAPTASSVGPLAQAHEQSALRRASWAVDFLLYEVGASDDQKHKAQTVVDATIADLKPMAQTRNAHLDTLRQLLAAPTVDRTQLEALRVASMSDADLASKRIAIALGDLLEILTPEQRHRLAERVDQWHRG